ncbi:MAG TPA: hypothetical protein DEQ80_10730 [Anaerolinea thermolimosa]|uniref:Uncharacterized protein n=1 Tax=Anaerolinea thermolimosa TaxID=229919 RepID=A0A3D1JIJ7_9CHLR|nr:DUF6056 family protein [Anaerolinea thermolimosa]GAP05317.1 hypothetical protein ATHL_00147 [Anaerolinea thermolimosa]HCE18323.1 hypothetical protein [Anaerolinea thermolimosa]
MAFSSRKSMSVDLAAAMMGVLVFAAGIAWFAYTGTFARYWADDYCYSAVAQDHGLLGSVWFWYLGSGNRFSTITLVALSEWLGSRAITFIPALVLGVWVVGWWYFLSGLLRHAGWVGRKRWWMLIGLLEVYFSALLAPDRLQSLYWRMGTLHYTFPLGLLLIHLGLMLRRIERPLPPWFFLGSGFLAFYAAGFSETFAALQTGLLGLGLIWGWLEGRKRPTLHLARLMVAAWIGSVLAMVVMFLSPSNVWRQAEMPPPASLWDLAVYTVRYTLDFMRYSVRGQPLPLLVFGMMMGIIGFLMASEWKPSISARKALLGSGLSLVIGLILLLCCVAPSVYAGLLYPAGRALMPARFVFLAGVSGAMMGLGLAVWTLVQKPSWGWVRGVAVLFLLAGCLYPFKALPVLQQETSRMALKAGLWDQRDAEIRAARAAGDMEVVVRETDVVQSLQELGPDPEFWVNRCAALYYDIDSITAVR